MSDEYVELDIEKSLRQKKSFKILRSFIRIVSILIIVGCIALFFISDVFKINEINITGNLFVDDQIILDYSKVSVGDNYYLSYLKEIDLNIEKNGVIKDVIVTRENRTINIKVIEEEVLFKSQNGFYFSSGKRSEQESNYPTIDFYNFEDSLEQDIIISELSKLSEENMEVFDYISQIRYSPVELNDERLVFYMRDSNQVTISPDQISGKMKYYFDVVDGIYSKKGLEVRGILHFDLGSDFEPFN